MGFAVDRPMSFGDSAGELLWPLSVYLEPCLEDDDDMLQVAATQLGVDISAVGNGTVCSSWPAMLVRHHFSHRRGFNSPLDGAGVQVVEHASPHSIERAEEEAHIGMNAM